MLHTTYLKSVFWISQNVHYVLINYHVCQSDLETPTTYSFSVKPSTSQILAWISWKFSFGSKEFDCIFKSLEKKSL
jgi:hypothetical protein